MNKLDEREYSIVAPAARLLCNRACGRSDMAWRLGVNLSRASAALASLPLLSLQHKGFTRVSAD